MEIEIQLQSLDSARPNQVLWQRIESQKNDLLAFLKREKAEVVSANIEPEAGFPTGLEPFLILVIVEFAKGVAEGTSEEIGKEVGKNVTRWLKEKFADITIRPKSEK
jgi:hypothetical protein